MAVTRIKSGEARIKWRDLLDQVYAQVYAGASDIIIERSGKDVASSSPQRITLPSGMCWMNFA